MTALTCTGIACGTGGWNGPLPGDPDSGNVTLSAYPTMGGITVRWSFPTINAHAVAHTRLFRGNSSSFSSAIQIAIEAGNSYYDEQKNTSRWYYWIQIISVNGTEGVLVGPASAVARDLSQDLLEALSNEIDRGALAIALRQELDVIPFLQSELLKEIFDRETGETSLAQAIQDANNGVAQAMTFIGQVNTSRVSDNQALAQTLQATAAVLQNGIAAVTNEVTVQVNRLDGKITSEATTRNQVVSQLDSKYAGITTQSNTKITQVDGRVSAEITARQQAVTNVGNRVTGVESNMTVIANELLNVFNASWTVRLQAGNLIGGFGLMNNSVIVEAGFDVDRFWVGKSGLAVKPFVIDGGIVYIDKARIRTADIDTLKIAGNAITSTNISQGGGGSVGANSSTVLNEVWIDMGSSGASGSSGVIVQGHVSMLSNGDASMYLQVIRIRDGAQLSVTPSSARGGWYTSFSVVGWDPYPQSGGNGYRLVLGNYTTGSGSNVSSSVASSALIASGGKR